jgi:hypothetical protein
VSHATSTADDVDFRLDDAEYRKLVGPHLILTCKAVVGDESKRTSTGKAGNDSESNKDLQRPEPAPWVMSAVTLVPNASTHSGGDNRIESATSVLGRGVVERVGAGDGLAGDGELDSVLFEETVDVADADAVQLDERMFVGDIEKNSGGYGVPVNVGDRIWPTEGEGDSVLDAIPERDAEALSCPFAVDITVDETCVLDTSDEDTDTDKSGSWLSTTALGEAFMTYAL